MKRTLFNKVYYVLLAVPFLFGCNDEAPYYGKGIESEYNRVYSSKQYKNHVTGDLELFVGDSEVKGVEAEFRLEAVDWAHIYLPQIFFDEPEIALYMKAVEDGNGGYKLRGTKTTKLGKQFDYEGSVGMNEGTPQLKLAIRNVTIPANYLSSHGTFTTPLYKVEETRISGNWLSSLNDRVHLYSTVFWLTYDPNRTVENTEWEYDEDYEGEMTLSGIDTAIELLFDVNILVHKFLSNLIYLLLEDITFNPDGTVSATYCPIPEELEILNLLFGDLDPTIRNEGIPAPANLLHYRVYNNEVLIKIDALKLLEILDIFELLLGENEVVTRSKGIDGIINEIIKNLDIILRLIELPNEYNSLIKDFLPLISDWLINGIRFKFVPNDSEKIHYTTGLLHKYQNKYKGDHKFYLDEKDLGDLFRQLPAILDLLGIDLDVELPINIPLLDINAMIETLMSRISQTQKLEIGLMLHD